MFAWVGQVSLGLAMLALVEPMWPKIVATEEHPTSSIGNMLW